MRPLLVILLPLVAVPVVPALAANHCYEKRLLDKSIVTECSAQRAGSKEASSSGRRGAGRPQELIKAISQVDGRACTIHATPTSRQGERELDIEATLDRIDDHVLVPGSPFAALWRGVLGVIPGCVEPPSPEQVAVGFLITVPLPTPEPYIAPGYALTGKLAYLETRAVERKDFTAPTPFGALRVVATRTAFDVDWGDGSGVDKGPFPFAGEPWPNGRITHTYTHMGRYDITVVERWKAEWSLAGATGTVTGLRSAPAIIEDFEARQLQAVRNR